MITSYFSDIDGDRTDIIDTKSFVFSGGEVSVKTTLPHRRRTQNFLHVYPVLESSEDIFELMMFMNAIEYQIHEPITKYLYISYLPYARQDRVCAPGEALAIKVFAGVINQLGFSKVEIIDAHSEIGPGLIDRSYNVSVDTLLNSKLKSLAEFITSNNLLLVSPDAGAVKKVQDVSKALGGVEIIKADKVRDPKTGNILATEVHGEDLTGKSVMIVDDICDGGRTFIELSKALKTKGADDVYLYVTHGIFSKGLAVLTPHFTKIYTTDTFNPTSFSPITINPLDPFLVTIPIKET